jgi:BioD-like phosphotransacetylase family protein
MSVMIKKTIWVLLAVAVLAFVLGTTVRADERNKQSVQLADASKAVVPAIAIDVTSLSLTDLETVPMAVMTPADRDAVITAVIQTRSLPNVAARVLAPGTPGVMRRLVQ